MTSQLGDASRESCDNSCLDNVIPRSSSETDLDLAAHHSKIHRQGDAKNTALSYQRKRHS